MAETETKTKNLKNKLEQNGLIKKPIWKVSFSILHTKSSEAILRLESKVQRGVFCEMEEGESGKDQCQVVPECESSTCPTIKKLQTWKFPWAESGEVYPLIVWAIG